VVAVEGRQEFCEHLQFVRQVIEPEFHDVGIPRRMFCLEFLQIGLRLKVAEGGGIRVAVLLQRVPLEDLVINIKILLIRPGGQGRTGQDKQKGQNRDQSHIFQM
jgi:hypothetical protein